MSERTASPYKVNSRHHPGAKTCHHFRYHRLTCDEYDELCARAGGRCEICRIPAEDTPRGSLNVDHCERYGYHLVRGLLCARCNAVMACHDGNKPWGPHNRQYADAAREYDAGAWWMTRWPELAERPAS